MMDFSDMKVGFINLTVGHWELLGPHINSIYEQYPYPKEFYIIPNNDYNMSLSAAINKGFKRALADKCDYIIYAADDTVLTGPVVQNLIRHAEEGDFWYVRAQGDNSSGNDIFLTRKEVYDKVGFWDEGFYPAYFEDNDYDRRMQLRCPERVSHLSCHGLFIHHGSYTINNYNHPRMQRQHQDFEAMQSRYIQKWGGLPHQEVYEHPWNEDYSKYPGF